ncbi:Hydroxymethylpyrimidine/phosphomethylpyrimidine kinase [Carnimonas sp. R-84981]|uniref:bifunctional hydroxymethylpyrimidine kinase/phosphomethylpyrimidine kinase n=1 Tax=Carnimonas bestiolae TaxID=3402172 RepID=UPI003EDBB99C
MTPPHLLSIAGTDPSGGAGQMADIKTFSALGGFGTSVITAVLAQNTQGVQQVLPMPIELIEQQLHSVFSDITIDAVKIGMVADRATAVTLHRAIEHYRPRYVVLDPVMVAKSGDTLVDSAGIAAVRDVLVPIADVITPNLPEAAALLDCPPPASLDDMQQLLPALSALGPSAILLKGGHLDAPHSADLLYHNGAIEQLDAPRIDTRNLHGSGCTLASAITALLPQRASLSAAVHEAKHYMTRALEESSRLNVGKGNGPAHHFWQWW